MNTTKKVILTGFKPFGNYVFNPTEDSTRYFQTLGQINNIQIIGVVLPCTYFGAFNILSKLIDVEKPDAIINTGLTSSAQGVRIETRFGNIMNGKYPDADRYEPKDLPLKPGGSEFLAATGDAAALAQILRSNDIPVEISDDSEGFICNALGYLVTDKILTENLSIKNIFIHIPWTDDYVGRIGLAPGKIFLKKEKFYKALELLIANV